jgi:hypothetical protein
VVNWLGSLLSLVGDSNSSHSRREKVGNVLKALVIFFFFFHVFPLVFCLLLVLLLFFLLVLEGMTSQQFGGR